MEVWRRGRYMHQATKSSAVGLGRKTGTPLQVVACAWLSDRCLVAVVSHSRETSHVDRATLQSDSGTIEVEITSRRHPADSSVRSDDTVRSVLVLRAGRSVRAQERLGLS